MIMEQKLTCAKMERHDFIKQKVAAKDMGQGDEPSSGSHLEAIYIKSETPDAGLEAIAVKDEPIAVKDEPIEWNHEPQASLGLGFQTVTFKREVDDVASEASSGHGKADDKLSDGNRGAYNTSPVYQRQAGTSQGSADPLSSHVSGNGSGIDATPDRFMSRPLLCEHCDYSTGRRDLMILHLRVRHKLGFYCEFPETKKSWRNLRTTFNRHINEQKNLPRESSAVKKKSEWHLKKQMSVLNPYLKHAQMSGNLCTNERIDLFQENSEVVHGEMPMQETAHSKSRQRNQKSASKVDDAERKYLSSISEDSSAIKQDHEDLDMHFLLSLLPDIRLLSIAKKRKFKIETLSLLDRLLCNYDSDFTSGPF